MRPPITDSVPLLAALLGLVVLAAFLGAAEASLLRVSRIRAEVLAEQGDRAAARVHRLTGDLTHTMNAVLLVVLLVQVGAATLAGMVAERHFGNTGVTIASVGLTLVMFVYAEAIPKTMAIRSPMATARLLSLPLTALAAVFRPIVRVLVAFADLQAPGHGVETGVSITEAELIRLAAEAEKAGAIEPTDRELIERAFAVGDLQIGEILTPRIDVIAVQEDTPVQQALDLALAAGHRRVPIYRRDLDEVTGLVRLRDLAAAVADGGNPPVSKLRREVLVVPESRRLIEVLHDMQRERHSMAVVIDEFGGTAGVATVEDVVEELVGEITDDDAAPVPEILELEPGHWVVEGGADLRALRAALGADLPHGDWSTAAGLIIGLAGRIPAVGEEVAVSGFRFRVKAATRRRVRRLEVIAGGRRPA